MRPMFWLSTAVRFLVRSGKITAVLSLMLFSALCALVFLSSLAIGVNDAMIDNSVRLFSGHITGNGLPASLPVQALKVAGVAQVLKRVQLPGTIEFTDRKEPITLVGVDPESEKAASALWRKTRGGRYLKAGEAALFLGKPMADRLNLKPGDRIGFIPRNSDASIELTVCGVFETGIYRIDAVTGFCPETVLPKGAHDWEAAVFLNKGRNTADILAAYHARFSDRYRFAAWERLMPDLKQLIDLNYLSMSLVILLVFAVVSVGIACGLVIFILKNMREYAIMKAMGTTTAEIAGLIYAKILILNLVTTIAGCLAGVLLVWAVAKVGIDLTAFTSHNPYFAVSGIIYPRLTLFSVGMPPVTALMFSLAAPVWPSAMIIRKKTADILRSV